MGINRFQIYFDNESGTFYPGQAITGYVQAVLDAPKSIRGVEVTLKGCGEVHWTESRSENDSEGRSHTVHDTYSASEKYFYYSYYIVGGKNSEITLPVGEHVWRFHAVLPQQLPSSFEGNHGHVRYTMKATMDRPWKFDHHAKVAFTVIAPLDLNYERQALEPVTKTEEKYLCCLCCQSGPISLTVRLPITGFVPGQEIPFWVEVDNATNEQISSVKCYIEKVVAFHATTKTRKETIKVTSHSLGSIGCNDSHTWMNERIRVPALPPSHLTHCKIIDIDYYFTVIMSIGGPHRSKIVQIPIIIGSIPLVSYLQPGVNIPPPSYQNITAPQPSLGFVCPPAEPANILPSAPPLHEYPDLPPPSYEECVLGGNTIQDQDDNEHTLGIQKFTPKYPMYDIKLK